MAIPLHECGFGHAAKALIQRWLNTDLILTLYGHPNQALSANGQNAKELDRLLSEFQAARDEGKLHFNTMGEIAVLVRSLRHRIANSEVAVERQRARANGIKD